MLGLLALIVLWLSSLLTIYAMVIMVWQNPWWGIPVLVVGTLLAKMHRRNIERNPWRILVGDRSARDVALMFLGNVTSVTILVSGMHYTPALGYSDTWNHVIGIGLFGVVLLELTGGVLFAFGYGDIWEYC